MFTQSKEAKVYFSYEFDNLFIYEQFCFLSSIKEKIRVLLSPYMKGIHAPEVSVLLSSFNGMPHLPHAVESVLNSENVSLELILINDGSTDETSHYLSSIVDSRVHVLHLNENRGIARAANEGLHLCRAKYIARMDADDLCTPHRLRQQVDYLNNHPEVGVISTQVELGKAEFRQEGYQLYAEWTNGLLTHEVMYQSRYRDSPVVNPSACFRAELIQEYGDYKTDVPEDYEFWMRLFEGGVRFAKLDIVGVYWRDHSDRLTRNHVDYSDASFRAVKVDYFTREWKEKGIDRPLFVWGKKSTARDAHRELTKAGIEVDGFVDFESGKWKGLPVLSIEEALDVENAFFWIAVRNRVGSVLIEKALKQRGRSPSQDFYFT